MIKQDQGLTILMPIPLIYDALDRTSQTPNQGISQQQYSIGGAYAIDLSLRNYGDVWQQQ